MNKKLKYGSLKSVFTLEDSNANATEFATGNSHYGAHERPPNRLTLTLTSENKRCVVSVRRPYKKIFTKDERSHAPTTNNKKNHKTES